MVGLVGGVAAGKSLVSSLLAEAGLRVVDADAIAHEVLETDEIRAGLVELFGPDVIADDGSIDRKRIANLVFDAPDRRRALEELTHPAIRTRLLADLDAALKAGSSVVLDAPLLVERGLIERCDRVVFVFAPPEVRRRRAEQRGMSPADWERRERSQASLEKKRIHADFVLDNSGDRERTESEIRRLLDELEHG